MQDVWHVKAPGGRKGTERISSGKTITVSTPEGLKLVTLPSIRLTWTYAWVKRDKNNEATYGPDFIDLSALPPSTVKAFEEHPDWGKDWKTKMVEKYKADPELAPGKPDLMVDVTMTAAQAKVVRDLLAEKGTVLPGPPLVEEINYSPAVQGAVGAGGRPVKSKQ